MSAAQKRQIHAMQFVDRISQALERGKIKDFTKAQQVLARLWAKIEALDLIVSQE